MLSSSLVLGLVLGVRHAMDVDHVATTASIVLGRTSLLGAVRTAVFWGLGHTLTFFAVGLGIVLFGIELPSLFEEVVQAVVGMSLIGLGLLQLLSAGSAPAQKRPAAARPLVLGCVHGLAGSAAIALFALTSVGSQTLALLYLALFGVGTVLGMVGVTLLLAYTFQLSPERYVKRGLVLAAGAISVLCGALICSELVV